MPLDMLSQNWMIAHFDYPIGTGVGNVVTSSGILLAPGLVAAGPVYTSDVFAIPSVKRKTLGLEITVTNPTSQRRKIQLVNEILPAAPAGVPPSGGSRSKHRLKAALGTLRPRRSS